MLGDSLDNHIGAERQEVMPSFSELTDSRIKDQDFDLVNIDSDDQPNNYHENDMPKVIKNASTENNSRHASRSKTTNDA